MKLIFLGIISVCITFCLFKTLRLVGTSKANETPSAFIVESEELISGSTTTVIRHKETGRRFVTKYSGGICELHDKEAAQ